MATRQTPRKEWIEAIDEAVIRRLQRDYGQSLIVRRGDGSYYANIARTTLKLLVVQETENKFRLNQHVAKDWRRHGRWGLAVIWYKYASPASRAEAIRLSMAHVLSEIERGRVVQPAVVACEAPQEEIEPVPSTEDILDQLQSDVTLHRDTSI